MSDTNTKVKLTTSLGEIELSITEKVIDKAIDKLKLN